MAVLLPAVSPTNSFTQTNAFPDQRNFNQYAIFVRIKNSVALDFTDNDLVSNAGSFGYRLRGAAGNELRASYRFSTTEDRFYPVVTGDYTNVILTLNRNDETVRHYFDGVQSGAAIDITGEAGFFSASAYDIQGSPTSLHAFDFERMAEWRDSLPTAQDILDLQAGAAFGDLQNPPTASYEPVGPNGNYVPELVDDTGSNDMPQTSGPNTGGLEPVYSGATDSVEIDFTGRVLNRTAFGSTMTQNFTGTFGGKTPTGIEFRVTQSGVPLPGLDWQPVANEVIGVDVWSGDIGPVPVGDDYVIGVRDAGDTDVMGTSGLFNVGIVLAATGQSNIVRQYAGVTTIPQVPNPNCYCYYDSGGGPIWQQLTTAIMSLANRISDLNGGIAVGIICEGQGATALEDLIPGTPLWDDNMVPALATVNNDIETALLAQGEQNAGDDMVIYEGNLNNMLNGFLSITGRDASNFVFLECQTGTDNNASPTNMTYVELRETQKSWAESTTGVKFASTTIDAIKVDSLHYTNDWYANPFNFRIAKSFQNALGLDAVDGAGPTMNSFYIDGADLRLRFNLRGAASIAANGVGDLVGFRLWTDNTLTTEVTISSSSMDGNEAIITPAIAPTEQMTITHFRLTNPLPSDPSTTNYVVGTGYDISDIAVQMGIAEFAEAPLELDVVPTASTSDAPSLDISLSAPLQFDISPASSVSLAPSLDLQIGGAIEFDIVPSNTNSQASNLSIQVGTPVRIGSFTINWA